MGKYHRVILWAVTYAYIQAQTELLLCVAFKQRRESTEEWNKGDTLGRKGQVQMYMRINLSKLMISAVPDTLEGKK